MKKSGELKPFATPINILLADDDEDDCLLFREAIEQLAFPVNLEIVHDGEQLLAKLAQKPVKIPHAIFLDIHMPRKNGFATLATIKSNKKLEQLPVIIFTTALDDDTLNLVYKDAAHYYIHKPADFGQLKNVIAQALTLISQKKISMPDKDHFVLTGDLSVTTKQ